MKTYKKRARITTAATVLAVVVAAVVGFTVWFAYHSSQVADSTLKSANKVSSDIPKVPAITDFASCEKAGGSKTLQTYPEQCVTTSGKKYTDTPKYLVIKEWGVKIPLSTNDSSVYYEVGLNGDVSNSSNIPTAMTIYAASTDALVGPAGVSCKGEYIAYLLRLPKNDPKWQPSTSIDDGNVLPIYGQRTVVGGYKYAIATHKEYGPDCFETTKSGAYNPDSITSGKFGTVVTAFTSDFKNIAAD